MADLVDAAWVLGGGDIAGDTAQSDYTTVVWVNGVGMGATITPAKGDTGKTLFVPNAGRRYDGARGFHGSAGYAWSTAQGNATSAWYLRFAGPYPSGIMSAVSHPELWAMSLRCVRS